jgi:hypothetical protein
LLKLAVGVIAISIVELGRFHYTYLFRPATLRHVLTQTSGRPSTVTETAKLLGRPTSIE